MQKVTRDLMAFKFLGGTKELQKNMVFSHCYKASVSNSKRRNAASATSGKDEKQAEAVS